MDAWVRILLCASLVSSWKHKYDPHPEFVGFHPCPAATLPQPQWKCGSGNNMVYFSGTESDLRSPGLMEGALGLAYRMIEEVKETWLLWLNISYLACVIILKILWRPSLHQNCKTLEKSSVDDYCCLHLSDIGRPKNTNLQVKLSLLYCVQVASSKALLYLWCSICQFVYLLMWNHVWALLHVFYLEHLF